MQNTGPDVSGRRRRPNGQFDNEFPTLAEGPDPFAQMSEDGVNATGRRKPRDWSDLDIPDHEIKQWKKARFTADDAYAWGYGGGCGFYPDQAEAWRRAGIHDPYEADEWNSHGFTPKEMIEWARNGFMSFSKDQPALWRDCGFPDPSEAGAWRKAGFNHAQALSWKEVELSPAQAKLEAKATADKFNEIPDMYEYYTPLEIRQLEGDCSYDSYDATAWKRLGFSPYAANDWGSAGYGPAQAAELRDQLLEDRVKVTQDVLEAWAKTEDAHQRYIDREKAYARSTIEHEERAALDRQTTRSRHPR